MQLAVAFTIVALGSEVNDARFTVNKGLPDPWQPPWLRSAQGLVRAGGMIAMYDDIPENAAVFDFDEVADHLLEQGLENSPSELHGCLCGLLAGGSPGQPEAGLAALNRALGVDVHGELAELLMRLFAVTAAALEDDEFDFYPLLPDDSVELDSRTAALGAWCRGFLAGFADAGAAAEQGGSALPGSSGEVLKDFAAIAGAAGDEDATAEESENSYADLVEYLRFAALNVYIDNMGAPRPPSDGRRMH